MLKKVAISTAAAGLVLAMASVAQAGQNDSGDYKGGALFGPQGQIFGVPRWGAYGYAGPRGAYAYAYAPRGSGSYAALRAAFPTAPWDEY